MRRRPAEAARSEADRREPQAVRDAARRPPSLSAPRSTAPAAPPKAARHHDGQRRRAGQRLRRDRQSSRVVHVGEPAPTLVRRPPRRRLLADAVGGPAGDPVVEAQAARGTRARRADRRHDAARRSSPRWPQRRPATPSTGRRWTSGGATSGSCPPVTPTATRPRPARPCSTPCRSIRPTCTRCRHRTGPTAPTSTRPPAGTPRELAAQRGRGAGDVPPFDVCMLGVGPDAHVASLFPEHPALHETERTVVAVHGAPKPPPTRITLTLPRSARRREVWSSRRGGQGRRRRPGAVRPGPGQAPAAGGRGTRSTCGCSTRGGRTAAALIRAA